GFRISRAPLSVYFESSVLIAKMVRAMSLDKTDAGIRTGTPLGSGNAGKSSWGNPAIRNRLAPHVTVTQLASPRLTLISLSGNARTISKSLFAGRVIVPGTVVLETQTDFNPISRSVA